ncbi:MAG: 2-polyprenyl-3-methyl-6-methoxy-1,4-benzoquinone monooxygenase [Gammaproteobacteria bacterium]|nr:2-polyprenyl-3-methyl-6-methoxy-1,4-benzoquinone monooxygenase [Gammaproteobacteria bacterium]
MLELSFGDRCIAAADHALRTLFGPGARAARENPGRGAADSSSREEQRETGRLMRVNHVGEVCAQALYEGQALVARKPELRAALNDAASEETDHLAWCEDRMAETGSRASLLNPLWYAGAFGIGVAAGLAGDRVSLGFVAETEHQVERHLDGHLKRLPSGDQRSRAILEQMKSDEVAHATRALESGGIALPAPVRRLMAVAGAVMTRTAHWI